MKKNKDLFTKLSNYASWLIIAIFFVLIIFTNISVLKIMTNIYPALNVFNHYVFLICVFILLPLSFFRPFKKFSAIGLMISSFVFGTTVRIYSFLITYSYWGSWGIFIGLFLKVNGFVFTGFLASLINLDWLAAFNIIFLFATFLGAISLSSYIVAKIDEDEIEEQSLLERRKYLREIIDNSNEEQISEFEENSDQDEENSATITSDDEQTSHDESNSETEPRNNLYCCNCGVSLPKNSKFCVNCGHKLT